MRHLDQKCSAVELPHASLRLDFETRQKVRSRTVATNGEVVGIHLPRGTTLHDGDYLTGMDGAVFKVTAARESLSVIQCDEPLELARAAYHLGSRGVRLQFSRGGLCYQADPALDHVMGLLGFSVALACLPFEPEAEITALLSANDTSLSMDEDDQQHGGAPAFDSAIHPIEEADRASHSRIAAARPGALTRKLGVR